MSYFERQTIRVKFATDPEIYIDLYNDITAGEMRTITMLDPSIGNIGIAVESIRLLAKEWNLADESGAVVAIDTVNLDRLKRADVNKISAAVNGIIAPADDNKKK